MKRATCIWSSISFAGLASTPVLPSDVFDVTKPPASSRKVATKSPALAAEVSQSRLPVAA